MRLTTRPVPRHGAARALPLLLAAALLTAAPASASTGDVTEFGARISNAAQPVGIAAGPDGNLWFTEDGGNRIGRITADGQVTEFGSGLTANARPTGIAAGPDGNLWFTEFGANRIGRITPTGQISEFGGLTPDSAPYGITAGPDGNLWFTEAVGNRIGRITPSGQVTEFDAGLSAGAGPVGIAAGPDGNLWFTENDGKRIGRITPAGQISEYGGPTSAPAAIAAGPDGNLWFTENSRSPSDPATRIGRITPTGQVTEYPTGAATPQVATGIAAGPDGNLWFADQLGGRVGRITPSGQVSLFATGISNGAGPAAIAVGPDGNLWFAERNGNQIGRIVSGAPAERPLIAGPAQAGRPQTCGTGSWPAAPQTLTRRWLRDAGAIAGAAGDSYVPTGGDVGHRLSCAVTTTFAAVPTPVTTTSAAVLITAADGSPGTAPGPRTVRCRTRALRRHRTRIVCVLPTAPARRARVDLRRGRVTLHGRRATPRTWTFTSGRRLRGRTRLIVRSGRRTTVLPTTLTGR